MRVEPRPVAPNRMMLMTLVFLGSILGGLAVAFLTSQIKPRVSDRKMLRDITGLPVLGSVAPVSLSLGAFNLTVAGSGFVNCARVLWNGAPLTTTFVSSSKLTATGTTTQLGSVSVTVANPGPGAVSI